MNLPEHEGNGLPHQTLLGRCYAHGSHAAGKHAHGIALDPMAHDLPILGCEVWNEVNDSLPCGSEPQMATCTGVQCLNGLLQCLLDVAVLHGVGFLQHGHDAGPCPMGRTPDASYEGMGHGMEHLAVRRCDGQLVQMPHFTHEIIDCPVLRHGSNGEWETLCQDDGHGAARPKMAASRCSLRST